MDQERIQSIDFVDFVVSRPIGKAFDDDVQIVASNCESIVNEIDRFSANRCRFPERIRSERKLVVDVFWKTSRTPRIPTFYHRWVFVEVLSGVFHGRMVVGRIAWTNGNGIDRIDFEA